jgi:hypothetical protein
MTEKAYPLSRATEWAPGLPPNTDQCEGVNKIIVCNNSVKNKKNSTQKGLQH